MATKKRTRKKQPKQSPLEQVWSSITRADVAGVVLILIAVFTLLSLMTSSNGSITGAWIDALEDAFGIGAWAFPLLLGAIGLWLVIHAVERMHDMSWQRPVGVALLFVAFITGAALTLSTTSSDGGGWLGSQIVGQLEPAITAGGTWALVTLLSIAGIVLLADRFIVDSGLQIWDMIQDWRYRQSETKMPPIQPGAPLPSGTIPLHKRIGESIGLLFSRFQRRPEMTPIYSSKRQPQDGKNAPEKKKAITIGGEATSSSTPSGARSTASQGGSLLSPRIIGGVLEAPPEWHLPDMDDMLEDWDRTIDNDDTIREQGRRIQETLESHGVPVDFEGAYKGPSVTQYLIRPGYLERKVRGETKRVKIKVNKITTLANDLALALAAPSVRIEAPIPGTNYVGVEVPNAESNKVGLKDLMESEEYTERKGNLIFALGEDVKGQAVVTDMTRMPHLLIAGATGSGKSVCINSVIIGLLLTHTPDSLRLLMIDPKMVELSVYNGIPHLLAPVVTEVDKASGILYWAVKEMERRYALLSNVGARDLARYNAYLTERNEKHLPFIMVVVDEMADLMMAAPEEVEKHICRLAQMARAVGIHLIIATQRPSVDVITGLIKANFPSRIAFAVTSQTDSRVILDVPGAERLLGRGDMLYMGPDASKLERLQGTWLTEDEISRVIRYWKGVRSFEDQGPGNSSQFDYSDEYDDGNSDSYSADIDHIIVDESPIDRSFDPEPMAASPVIPDDLSQAPLFDQIDAMKSVDARDELYDDAVGVVADAGRGSITLLQRKLRIGYGRASRLVEQLESDGVLSADLGGNKGRKYLGDGSQSTTLEMDSPIGSDIDGTPLGLSEGDASPPRTSGEEADSDGSPQVWM
jgi:S-DNA-T family DNA segregation ATPase FtsK/SpoIIIE